MPASLVTAKGQTTIPKKIRNHLRLKPGDRIDFIVETDGKVVLEPATHDIQELEGILHRSGMQAISVEDMNKALRQRFQEKHRG